jgi:hypothetical protein
VVSVLRYDISCSFISDKLVFYYFLLYKILHKIVESDFTILKVAFGCRAYCNGVSLFKETTRLVRNEIEWSRS